LETFKQRLRRYTNQNDLEIISTGGFTLEARREATRDGAPPLDLIDGRLLAEKLKELKLGVKTNLVEHVEVLDEWFRTI
jgi:restriction system protein